MMKSVVSLLMGGILVLGMAFPSAAQNKAGDEKVTTNQRIELEIEGMACSMCEQSCKKSLEKLDGVKVEKISASEGIARLIYTGSKSLSDKKLKEVVENAGYILAEVQREDNKQSGDGPVQ